jgi:RNA polymerase sigma-70 factor (ECF subfamily)
VEDLTGLTDMELVKLAGGGNDQAFGLIVSRYQEQIARTVKGMLGETDGADDVGQETFIRFYRSLKKYRGDAALGTYLSRIAINLSLNELNKRKKVISLFKKDKDDRAGEVLYPVNEPERKDTKEMVDKALQKLDPGQRSVVVLRLLQGYSTKETADILDVPLGTVLSRLSRAQKNLKKILTPLI